MKPWRARFDSIVMEAAALVLAADDSAHQIDMSDPKQNMDFQSDTAMNQLRLALNTLEAELTSPDGMGMEPADVDEAKRALKTLSRIVDRIETKLASYMAQHREKPPSEGLAAVDRATGSHLFGHLVYQYGTDFIGRVKKSVAEHFELDPEKQYPALGAGADGMAFDLGDGKVLKFTRDLPEAKAMYHLLKKDGDPSCFVQVFDVIELRVDESAPKWFILQEKLSKADSDWQMFATNVGEMQFEVYDPHVGDHPMNVQSAKIVGSALKWVDQMGPQFYMDNASFEIIDPDNLEGDFEDLDVSEHSCFWVKRVRDLDVKIEWLNRVGAELERMGISFWDFHKDNIMKRGSQHVLIDLGRSRSGVADIEEVAAKTVYLKARRSIE